jgi:hypothetical protein
MLSETTSVRTLDLNEAAAFLHMHPEEVRTRTERGLIPGAKTGRRRVLPDAPQPVPKLLQPPDKEISA